ncbi:nitrite reductase small subunit NirD [Proteus mirabilis]|uniref:nitrite reductase small subunit NirD n=1 Tax=Proteus mirabilis TaxID=584 RepID=UPI0012B4565E|nr:nitrite reductase small subunit NirD [Proteus mirabilis]QGM68975.1 nitrite reductase small subunit NirD [Proteus mirabilis]HCB2899954.1 nitrite reductase small subunit NirD [Proteus mirabilis]HCB2909873.1 nitrite reductase small subunit NirD [Proteus mirabilis]HCT3692071.1 nitrite reductase small subunit NirD [Proteus mirabilis]HEJ1042520.1 nitrite reductase small subunit NirD [Proteus mirabilis]
MSQWIVVCQLDDITVGTGVCALVEQDQVAIFRPYQDERLYALSNIDPFAQASVLSRGLIAEHDNELYIVSPLKKQHFRLTDGYCLEDEHYSITHYEVKVEGNTVSVRSRH